MSHAVLPIRGHAAALLRLGLPLVGSHVAQVAITVTDAVMLGWYDVTALAAQVLGGMLFFVLFIMGSGFAWAVMPLIAESAGRGDETQVRRLTRMGMWLSVLFAVAAMPAFLSAGAILLMLGQVPETAELAGQYLRIAGWSILPALIVMVLKSYLAALERTRIVFLVTLGAVALNAGANWLLIFGKLGLPELGIRGAAVATLLVNLFLLAGLAAYAMRVLPEHRLFSRLWRPDTEAFGRVFRLGWPIGLTSLAEVGLFAASSVMMGWLGTVPLAAHGIAMQLTSLTFVVHLGLANAATVRAGQAFGRGDTEALRRGGLAAMAMSAGFAAVTMVVFLTLPGPLVGLFLDPAEPERAALIALGGTLLAAAALFQTMDAGQVIALGLLRGVLDARVPMVIATLSYWGLGIPVSYLLAFPLGLGGLGIWLGLAMGLAMAAVLLMRRFWTHGIGLVAARVSTVAIADGAEAQAKGSAA